MGLFSPVIQRSKCSDFKESLEKRLESSADARAFSNVLQLWSGLNDFQEREWGEIKDMSYVAHYYDVPDVLAALEEAMMKNLDNLCVEICVEILNLSIGYGLKRLEAVSRRLASERFGEVMATPGFTSIDETTLRSILEQRGVDKVQRPCALLKFDESSAHRAGQTHTMVLLNS